MGSGPAPLFSGVQRAFREAQPRFAREAGAQTATATLGSPNLVAVVDAEPTDAILEALADRWSAKIICSAIERAKTVTEICSEQGLPQSSCYKRIKRLVNEGLIMVEERILTGDGKRSTTYRSTISYVSVKVVGGKMDVQVGFNPAVIDKMSSRRLAALWRVEDDVRADR